MDRRHFLSHTGAALGGIALARHGWAAKAAGAGAAADQGLGPIGLQLYTVREAMARDPEGTLARVASLGYREVELAGLHGRSATQFRQLLDANRLVAPSMHVPLAQLGDGFESTLADAKTLGCRYVVMPFLQEPERRTLADYRAVAARLNRAGEQAAKAGLSLAYHNHDFEFVPLEGRLPYDVLMEACDPRLVLMEIDLYWITRAGHDPLRYFARWPGRTRLVHVKDTSGPPGHRMMDVGAGVIDWPRLLARARQAGVEHFIVEHDQPADAFASIAASQAYLARLRLVPPAPRKSRLPQSVARWTLQQVPLPEVCSKAKAIGLQGIDLLYPDEWATAREAGLVVSMAYASRREHFIEQGFNDPRNHAMLLDELEAALPQAAAAGVPSLIAMFGNRHGGSREEDIATCIAGLAKIAPSAERHGVTICVELLNSKADGHVGYEGDHTAFGLEVVQAINSPRIKLLYDIYHMQIMEGDVIHTIREALPWIGHFHTGGVPGRHEIGPQQELNYRAIALAIADLGYQGFVAHEFVATGEPFASLAEAYRLFEV